MTRDTTLGACAKRLIELGYAPTSFTNPDRLAVAWHGGRRLSLFELANHEACIVCLPGSLEGAEKDASERQVLELIETAYLLADPKQTRAVQGVLDRYGLLNGPSFVDGFGNRHRPLQWHGSAPIYQLRTRLCFDSDDHCVILQQSREPRYIPARDRVGGYTSVMEKPPESYTIPVGADWKGAHILDTPYEKLPELSKADAAELIAACEEARWGARPLAAAKDAA